MQFAQTRAIEEERSLAADLGRPEAYDLLESPEEVQRVETHISWVFLVGSDVFKVKKPVNLGFVDFGTREQRRLACEAEVNLNRRLAPRVYIGVVPVRRGGDGRARIGGAGPLLDWAVHMARLPDRARADHQLSAGALTASAIDAIATKLSQFHASCPSNESIRPFGTLPVIERNVEENFAQTQEFLGEYLSSDQSEELLRWQRSFLRGHAALFERRAAEGHVRDGHGDLRLEHVYLENGEVTVIDCIEFNDRFRFADVCADVAFLSMDLAEHGRVDFAELLLAAYAREANDFDFYTLVDFYESYRAFVRGKIAAMVAHSAAIDMALRHRAAREARRYFLLALSAGRRSLLLPAVVAVGGVIASGKSTIAQRVGVELSAPIVDADRTRKAMVGIEPTRRLNDEPFSGSYDPGFTEEVYREVLRRADVVLASRRPVVLDASFRSAGMRQAARDLASKHGVPFRFIECRAPATLCRERLRQREGAAVVSDGRLAIFDTFCSQFEAVRELPADDHLILDTSRPLEVTLAELRSRVEVWPRAFVK